MKNKVLRGVVLAGVCCLLLHARAYADGIVVKSGEKIAFLGDSITAQGSGKPLGYVRLVIAGLKANGVEATAIPAGVSGNKSNDMLARLDRDVITKKPDWMTLSCGVNDVWHGANGVPLEDYKKNITQIIEKVQAANIKVVVLTSTLIGEDVDAKNNQTAIAYNDFLREIAKDKNCILVDLNADFRAFKAGAPEADRKKNQVTVDGVHMNYAGDQMMAGGILKGFGLGDDQLKKARDYWYVMPGTSPLKANVDVSLAQYEVLQKAAAAQGKTLDALFNEQLQKYVDSLLAKPAG